MFRVIMMLLLVLTGVTGMITPSVAAEKTETAVFAGGCFWCMHAAFEQLEGVTKVSSGYTGGHIEDPTYNRLAVARQGIWKPLK